jgi:hypothetical protein
VVVDDVQDDAQAVLVGSVDQTPETLRAAVHVGRSEQVHAVVAPVARAGKLSDGERLDGRDPQTHEAWQRGDEAVERALGCNGADVALIDDQALDV